MGFHYKIHDQSKAYFVTFTVTDWIDAFTRRNHKLAIVESLKFCQEKKQLVVYAWCLMSNHLHMVISSDEGRLSDFIRDFKKFTSTKIVAQIKEEPESRREWMLKIFQEKGELHPKKIKYKFWQDSNHPVELYSNKFIDQKINYIHNNPVKEMFVEKPWEYLFSSARNYAGMKGLIEVSKP